MTSISHQIGIIATFSGIICLAVLDTQDWTETFMALNLTFAVIINTFRALYRATTRFSQLPCGLSF